MRTLPNVQTNMLSFRRGLSFGDFARKNHTVPLAGLRQGGCNGNPPVFDPVCSGSQFDNFHPMGCFLPGCWSVCDQGKLARDFVTLQPLFDVTAP